MNWNSVKDHKIFECVASSCPAPSSSMCLCDRFLWKRRSAFVFPPPGIARQDWKIVRALGEFVGVTLPYSSEEEMEERVNTLVPLTVNMDEVSPSEVRTIMMMVGMMR